MSDAYHEPETVILFDGSEWTLDAYLNEVDQWVFRRTDKESGTNMCLIGQPVLRLPKMQYAMYQVARNIYRNPLIRKSSRLGMIFLTAAFGACLSGFLVKLVRNSCLESLEIAFSAAPSIFFLAIILTILFISKIRDDDKIDFRRRKSIEIEEEIVKEYFPGMSPEDVRKYVVLSKTTP